MKKRSRKSITIKDVAETIDSLAIMTQNGFVEIDKKFEEQREYMDDRFDGVELRLDRIENLILTDHTQRLERLEDRMRRFEVSK